MIACAPAGLGASSALAQATTTTNPAEELWRAYPLEQSPTNAAPAPARTQATRPPARATEQSGSDLPWILLLGVAAGVAVGVLVALVLSRRQRARGISVNGGAEADPAPPPEAQRPVAAPVEVVPAPAPPRDGPSSDTPVCHVRWSRRGARFFAVTIGPDGTERRIARSPQFNWRGPSPPERSPEAQAALRELAKELRDKGWRPLRAKAIDFDERRWYARRFRWPTDVEDKPPATRPAAARPSVRGKVG